MNAQDATITSLASGEGKSCHYLHFGLVVTGKSERMHLPKLFRSLMSTGICTFQVIQFTGQRRPITSIKRKIAMVGSGKIITDRDQNEIALPARRYLKNNPCCLVILVDDLENDWREQAQEVFDRYRQVLDTMLTDLQKMRTSVHFLVNMLEAYYFADARAINAVLPLDSPLEDYKGDVENIRNPKAEILKLYPAFREIDDGGKILDVIDIEHVLSRPDTCAWLRTLFAWCAQILEQHPAHESFALPEKYRLHDGILCEVTRSQLKPSTI
jgi:hypothetical protein